jgi:hypothetical protein
VKDDDRIRFIFRKRRRFTRASAAVALDRSVRWVESDRFAAENGGFVSWQEMVLLAYLRWTSLQIHRALGATAATVFPALAQLVTLTVRIPAHKVIALRHQARRRGLDVSELVSDDVSVFREEAEDLEQHQPGYLDAWHFPYTRKHDNDLTTENRRAAERVSDTFFEGAPNNSLVN